MGAQRDASNWVWNAAVNTLADLARIGSDAFRLGKGVGCALFNDQASISDKARAVAADIGRGLTLPGAGFGARVAFRAAKGVGKAASRAARGTGRATRAPKGTTSVDDLTKSSTFSRRTRHTRQFNRSGGLKQANKDFDALGLRNVKNIDTRYGPGRTGVLPDGRKVSVRPGSSKSGPPTLEIQQGRRRTKFRYYD